MIHDVIYPGECSVCPVHFREKFILQLLDRVFYKNQLDLSVLMCPLMLVFP